jgi:hypothetical protein
VRLASGIPCALLIPGEELSVNSGVSRRESKMHVNPVLVNATK